MAVFILLTYFGFIHLQSNWPTKQAVTTVGKKTTMLIVLLMACFAPNQMFYTELQMPVDIKIFPIWKRFGVSTRNASYTFPPFVLKVFHLFTR